MKWIHHASCWPVLCCLLLAFPVMAQSDEASQEFPSLEYERTQVRTIHSEIIGHDFQLWISLPKSYDQKDSANYPVIYLMDPYRSFSIVKGLTDVLSSPSPYINEVILVGVGYGASGQEAMLKWALGRVRDYTPEADTAIEELYRKRLERSGLTDVGVLSGGAPHFLNALRNEIIPFVESSYRINPNERMLIGYSLGGLFGFYVLFHSQDLFQKYFIGSPSIHFKNEITFSYESNYASQHSDLKAEVFMSAGSLEERTSLLVKKMEELLLSRSYENLSLNTVIFDNESHVTCYPGALSRAISLLLKSD